MKFVFGCLLAIVLLVIVVTRLGLAPAEVVAPATSVKQPAATGRQGDSVWN